VSRSQSETLLNLALVLVLQKEQQKLSAIDNQRSPGSSSPTAEK
jgi:hypothetical protein